MNESFNTAQKEAVLEATGRVLILAGAGSGKTKVLTAKIEHLIQKNNVSPEAILGLTFTRKAAEEMRSRLASRIGQPLAKRVMLSTFHSFCTFILRREIHHLGYAANFTIYDRQDVQRLVRGILKDILGHEESAPSINKIITAIGFAKNRALDPDDVSDSLVREVFARLNESFKAYNSVDFDHLLYLTHKLFCQHPEVLAKYQQRFQFALIDEYQDTNPIQAKIAEAITAASSNLCVVGDDDQSIYSWRGADVNNILAFPHTKRVTLEQNFRSTNTILRAANSVIHYNEKRHSKALWSEKGDGDPIEIFYAPTEQHEAEAVVARLLERKERLRLSWSDFAVLYRSNIIARALESAFLKATYSQDGQWKRGIPYDVYGGDEFYEHKEVKDLLAYLRVIANVQDHEAILRVLNYPRRGIGEQAMNALVAQHRQLGVPLWHVLTHPDEVAITDKAKQGVRRFATLIQSSQEALATEPPSVVLEKLIESIQFHQAMCEEVKNEALQRTKTENIQGLLTSLRESESVQQEGPYHALLTEFLSTILVEKVEHWKKEMPHQRDHVHLMTFHSAKGLEFTSCFLVGMEDSLMPHERSIIEGNLEEERRLMYVAMTRAKEYLTLSMAASRQRMGKCTATTPSRFLFEIPKELLQTTKWDKRYF